MSKKYFTGNSLNHLQFMLEVFLLSSVFGLKEINVKAQQPKKWIAPQEADAVKNPLNGKAAATAKGKTEFVKTCLPCHGTKGKGDGPAGINLKPRPQDLMSAAVQEQSDGAIFWKITEGRAPMASYKTTFTVEQRWQLVNYLRQLKAEAK
jgi:mono/diheme cytochrome c family protein